MEAVVDLTTQFETLDIALKMAKQHQVRNGNGAVSNGVKQTAVERVNLMRRWLILTGETKATRLLETLLLSKPNFVDYNRKGADWVDPQNITEKVYNAKPARERISPTESVDKDASYLLVDRMSFAALRSSNCRIRFRLRVTENGAQMSVREFLFEASASHGYLANAAYTNAPQKVERLRSQLDAFYDNFMRELAAPPVPTPLWDTAIGLLKGAPRDFQFIATAMLDYWDRDASFQRRLDRISNSNREAWASAFNTTMQGSTGDLFERAFGTGTARGARMATTVGSEAFRTWLRTTAQDADFDRARKSSLYARNPTVRALRYLTAPGMEGVITAFLEDAS
ncbi:MAG: hypothetical protein ACPHM0_02210, partial [Flavobacteriales bacterium]